MANWCIQVADKLERLFYLLHQEIKLAPLIHINEMTLQVINEAGRNATSKSHLWVLRCGAFEQPLVYFAYDPSRSGKMAQELLAGYEGLAFTYGHAGYRYVEAERHGHCWAHARRKFAEALKLKKSFVGLIFKNIRRTGSADVLKSMLTLVCNPFTTNFILLKKRNNSTQGPKCFG